MVPRLELHDSAAPARVTTAGDVGRTGHVQRNRSVTVTKAA